MGIISNKISRDKLKSGDHIYSWRLGHTYAHHGIYVGDGQVIHYTRPTGTSLDKIVSSSSNHGHNPCYGDKTKDGGVISTCLDCFLGGGDLYVFKYKVSRSSFLAKPRGGTCTTASSDPPQEVIHRANFLLQNNGFGVYNFFKNNCEDFANYCKTGLLLTKPKGLKSGQTSTLAAAAFGVLVSPLALSPTVWVVAGVGGLVGVMVVTGCSIYSSLRLCSDIGMRKDVIKVPVESLLAHMLHGQH